MRTATTTSQGRYQKINQDVENELKYNKNN